MSAEVRGTLWALVAGGAVQRLSLFVTTIVLARGLGLAELGRLAFGLQAGALLALLADAGVRAVTARDAAASEREVALALVRRSLRVRSLLALALVAAWSLGVMLAAPDQPAFWLCCGALALPAVFDLKGIAESLRITRLEVRLEGAVSIGYLAAVAGLAAGGHLELVWIAVALLAARASYATAVVAWLVRRPVSRAAREAAAALRPSRRAWGAISIGQVLNQAVYTSDVLLIRLLAGEAAAGLFHAAHKVAIAAQIPLGMVGRLVQPHLHHAVRHGDQRATLDRVVRASAYLIVPIAAGGAVVAEGLLVALYGEEFAAAGFALRWLLLSAAVVGVGSRFGNLLFARREHRRYLSVMGLGMATNVLLSVALIPALGASGSAFATCVATSVSAATAFLLVRRRVRFQLRAAIARPLLLAALTACAAWLVPASAGPALRIAAGAACFLLGLWWLELRGGLGAIGAGLVRSSGFGSRQSPGDGAVRDATPAGTPRAPARASECCAVVVHYRCLDDTLRCLRSLLHHAPDLPVVVVDNASGDGSRAALEAGCAVRPATTLVCSEHNRGFGAGCNLGIEEALAQNAGLRHVLLLNPDTTVTAGFLERLLDTAAHHPDAGVVGCRIRRPDGSVWFENGRLRRWTLSRSHVRAPEGAAVFETGFVTGALMLVDAALLRDGLRFDERYFLYAEDLDLCCEVRARGRTLWVDTRAEVVHAEGGSQRGEAPLLGALRARQLRWMTRGKALFARKRLGALEQLCFFAVALVLKPLAGVFVARSVRFLPPYFAGLWDGVRAR